MNHPQKKSAKGMKGAPKTKKGKRTMKSSNKMPSGGSSY